MTEVRLIILSGLLLYLIYIHDCSRPLVKKIVILFRFELILHSWQTHIELLTLHGYRDVVGVENVKGRESSDSVIGE